MAESGPDAGSARQEWDAEAEFGQQNKNRVEHESKNASAGSASAALRHRQVQLGPPFWWGPGASGPSLFALAASASPAGWVPAPEGFQRINGLLQRSARPVTAPVTVLLYSGTGKRGA